MKVVFGVKRPFLRVIRMMVHFSWYKDICQSDSHFSSAVRSYCTLQAVFKVVCTYGLNAYIFS